MGHQAAAHQFNTGKNERYKGIPNYLVESVGLTQGHKLERSRTLRRNRGQKGIQNLLSRNAGEKCVFWQNCISWGRYARATKKLKGKHGSKPLNYKPAGGRNPRYRGGKRGDDCGMGEERRKELDRLFSPSYIENRSGAIESGLIGRSEERLPRKNQRLDFWPNRMGQIISYICPLVRTEEEGFRKKKENGRLNTTGRKVGRVTKGKGGEIKGLSSSKRSERMGKGSPS